MTYHVTAEKLEELKAELETLKTTRRQEIAERLKRAKELGDLSENSEYFEARDEQQFVETRISELEETIRNAAIIKLVSGKDIVHIGSTIEVTKEGQNFKYTIVGPNEADPAKGFISNESPIGRAFLGKKAGETVEIEIPSGKATYTIAKIA